jgi:uncharacterized protein with HEPN domain
MRDVLSHHYFDMNTEAIYNVCEDELDILEDAIARMLEEL